MGVANVVERQIENTRVPHDSKVMKVTKALKTSKGRHRETLLQNISSRRLQCSEGAHSEQPACAIGLQVRKTGVEPLAEEASLSLDQDFLC